MTVPPNCTGSTAFVTVPGHSYIYFYLSIVKQHIKTYTLKNNSVLTALQLTSYYIHDLTMDTRSGVASLAIYC